MDWVLGDRKKEESKRIPKFLIREAGAKRRFPYMEAQ